jgi:hypothetical protein
MKLRIQGETYADRAEVVDTIGRLEADYLTMADGQARADLLTHIERLKDAVDGRAASAGTNAGGGNGGTDESPSSVPPEPPAAASDPEPEPESEGAEPVCPMCNGEGVLEVEPPLHPSYERCADCDGFGLIYTGSRRGGRAVEDCPTCQGDGFKKRANVPAVEPMPAMRYAQLPEWSGAQLAPDGSGWLPPLPATPPWDGATWDKFYGRWS